MVESVDASSTSESSDEDESRVREPPPPKLIDFTLEIVINGRFNFNDENRTSMSARHSYVVELVRAIWEQARSTQNAGNIAAQSSGLSAKVDVTSPQRNLRALDKQLNPPRYLFRWKSMPSVTLYRVRTMDVLSNRMISCQAREEPPTPDQARVLTAVVKRLKIEFRERQDDTADASVHEPLLLCVHGSLGTGESQVIKCSMQLLKL